MMTKLGVDVSNFLHVWLNGNAGMTDTMQVAGGDRGIS